MLDRPVVDEFAWRPASLPVQVAASAQAAQERASMQRNRLQIKRVSKSAHCWPPGQRSGRNADLQRTCLWSLHPDHARPRREFCVKHLA
jgi:hypothetical protein